MGETVIWKPGMYETDSDMAADKLHLVGIRKA